MQVGDFYASRFEGEYQLLEIISHAIHSDVLNSRTIMFVRDRDSAIATICEMAREWKTDAWVADDGEGSEQPVARHRPLKSAIASSAGC